MEGRRKVVVSILETFGRICSLNIKNAVVQAEDFFHESAKEETRVGGHLDGLLKLQSWASADLVFLAFKIGGPNKHWCPPGETESVNKTSILEPAEDKDGGYPLYNLIKARLDGYAHLDQSQVRYQFS